MTKSKIAKIIVLSLGLSFFGNQPINKSESLLTNKDFRFGLKRLVKLIPTKQTKPDGKPPELCYPLDAQHSILNPFEECLREGNTTISSRIYSYKNNNYINLDQLVDSLSKERIIYIGENHVNYFMHINQAAIIEGLAKKNQKIIIAMEMFQTEEDQQALDSYTKGKIELEELLNLTSYKETWGYSFSRNLADTFRVAKAYNLKLAAVDMEVPYNFAIIFYGMDQILDNIEKTNPKQLSEEERKAFDVFSKYSTFSKRADGGWDAKCKDGKSKCEVKPKSFLQSINLRNDVMAGNLIKLINQYPDHQIVFLNGNLHSSSLGIFPKVEPYSWCGIPERISQWAGIEGAIILQYEKELIPHQLIDKSGEQTSYMATPSEIKKFKDTPEFPDYSIHVDCSNCDPLPDYSLWGL